MKSKGRDPMTKRRFMVTAGLPYSNGRLHVGHLAGAYLPADIFVRYMRARGEEVCFVCGSDDNGVASLMSARKEGRPVEELVANYHDLQDRDFQGMGIEFDVFGGTHHPDFVETHNRISQEFFKTIHDHGYFVKRSQKQLFDVEAGQFLPDRYAKGTCPICGNKEAFGDQCDVCGGTYDQTELIDPISTITGTRPEMRETTHWFLQLQKFEEPLRKWLESKRQPSGDEPAWRDHVLNFCLGQIKNGLPERAMTRDLDWGVPVPLEDPDARGKVLYVWFDAPIGYISFTAQLEKERGGDYADWWKNPESRIVHFIGEDNTVFHALIWPAMLMAEGTYQLPAQVVANAFLNIKIADSEEKFSKSRGNAIWVGEYLQELEPDPLRYYLTAIAPESSRTAFEMDDFIQRNNSELLGALGNFVNRVMTFGVRYFDAQVPPPGSRSPRDLQHLQRLQGAHEAVTAHLENYRFKAALGEVMALARDANVYFNEKEPWAERKRDLAACATTINLCLLTTRTLATLMAPFLPFSAAKTATMLGLADAPVTVGELSRVLPWEGAVTELADGQHIGEPVLLFRTYPPEGAPGSEAS